MQLQVGLLDVVELGTDGLGEDCGGASSVMGAQHGAHPLASQPEGRTVIAQEPSPTIHSGHRSESDGEGDDSGASCRDDTQLIAQGAEVRRDGVVGQQHSTDSIGLEGRKNWNGVFVVAGSR